MPAVRLFLRLEPAGRLALALGMTLAEVLAMDDDDARDLFAGMVEVERYRAELRERNQQGPPRGRGRRQ